MDQRLQMWLTFGIAGGAIVIGGLLLLLTELVFHGDSEPGKTIPAIVGPAFTMIGTLVGYVAGHAGGAAGKERSEERARTAQDLVSTAQEKIGKARASLAALDEAGQALAGPQPADPRVTGAAPLQGAAVNARTLADLAHRLYEEFER